VLTFWPNLGVGIVKEVVPQIAVKFHALMVYFHTQGACLWPCHLHLKVSQGKRRNMEIQIFHHAKITFQKNPLK
jgi:hypothetical protein